MNGHISFHVFHFRLTENQNRDRTLLGSAPRRRHASPTTYYISRPSSCFGDEENIEPLTNRNNNNNNSLLATFQPILLQTSSPTITTLPLIKRESHLLDEDESRRSTEDDSVVLTSPSPYSGEILIESPETGRLVPLKLEDPEATAQLVYVSAEGLPAAAYYKHELAEGATTEFIDVVSWWDQQQQHHHIVQHQPTHQQTHQQISQQQRLAHV